METPRQNPKKQSHLKDANSKMSSPKASSLKEPNPLENKQLRNGVTPPPITVAHTQHGNKATQQSLASGSTINKHATDAAVLETIDEDEESKEAETKEHAPTFTSREQLDKDKMNVDDLMISDQDEDPLDDEELPEDEEELPLAMKQNQPDTGETESIKSKSSDKELPLVQQVDPHKWCQLHDKWLHAAMRAAMGNTTLQTIPDLENIKCIECNLPIILNTVKPQRTMIKWYDLCLNVQKGNDQVNLFHQVFMQ